MREPEYLAQVVGMGPAGLGIAVAADRQGVLEELLTAGVAWFDPRPGGCIGDYGIVANSPWADYVESVYGDLFRPVVREFPDHGESQVPLPLVGLLCNRLCERLEDALPAFPSAIHREVVAGIRLQEGGSFVSLSSADRELAVSRKVVLAAGGEERLLPAVASRRNAMLASTVFRGAPMHQRRVNILGASHSAAAALKKLYSSDRGLEFVIWHRGKIRMFYASGAEAERASYAFEKEDVCPRTGRVHRFGGVRSPYRELLAFASSGQAPNIQVQNFASSLAALMARIPEHEAIVQALGFRARRIPICAPDGAQIGPLMTNDVLAVDDHCRILDFSGKPIFGAYALGLGHQPLPSPLLGGEPSYRQPVDGVNLYFGPTGSQILAGLID